MTPDQLIRHILTDMKVDLSDMFDRNFEKKGYFGKKWAARKDTNAKGSLLIVSGAMRRSIRGRVENHSLRYTSHLPYPVLHNEGAKGTATIREHNRLNKKTGNIHKVKRHTRQVNIPQRQFLGNHAKVREAVKAIIAKRTQEYFEQLAKTLKP